MAMVGLHTFFSLESLSFLYLFLSFALYFLVVLKAPVATALFFILLIGCISFYRELYAIRARPLWSYFKGPWTLPTLLYLALWIWDSGQGAFTGQSGDHLKHNAMLNSLMHFDWPVFHPYAHDPEHGFYLVYYLGHYVYPAIVGKLTQDWFSALHSQFFFLFFGLGLILGWISRILGRLPAWIIFFLIFFSGLDYLGFNLRHGHFARWGLHLEFWWMPWQFSGNHTLLFWVPQHLIAGWLSMAVLYTAYKEKWSMKSLAIWPALSFWWSAFAPIGLILVFLLITARRWWQLEKNIKKVAQEIFSGSNLCLALIPAVLCALYYQGLLMNVRQGPIVGNEMEWPDFLFSGSMFLLAEVGAYGLALLLAWQAWSKSQRLFLLSLGLSAGLILFYRMGTWNDFGMRASIPVLFGLQLLILELWAKKARHMSVAYAQNASVIIFLVGGVSAMNELSFSYSPARPNFIAAWDALNFEPQYLSSAQTTFFTQLAPRRPGVARAIDATKARELMGQVKEKWKSELSLPEFSLDFTGNRLPSSITPRNNLYKSTW